MAGPRARIRAGNRPVRCEPDDTKEMWDEALRAIRVALLEADVALPVVKTLVDDVRKRAVGVIPLDRYVTDGMMTVEQAEFLRSAVRERQNILIAGGTSTGKTTLAKALAAARAAQRAVRPSSSAG